ncbi:DUF5670 family protein [Clostridium tetanomorphum]|uniref:DUF5670 family protein n=1 Tax=Clostridium tetanomorphum TaxID=1553 RepID=UPI001F4C93D7|nr:DUF5670 family protein [Clostridium tetanomorphum]NRZ95908.1 hypothetical protein [Clostridium tetanomorphum]
MGFIRWLSAFILLFWLIGLIFRIGGKLINFLLLISVIIFVVDSLFLRKKSI